MLKVYGSMYDTYKQESLFSLNFSFIFVVRRLFFSILWVNLVDYPALQILIMITTSLSLLIYDVYTMPIKDKTLNILEIINELSCLISLYCYLLFTDWISDTSMRINFGWLLILITIMNLAINIGTIIV